MRRCAIAAAIALIACSDSTAPNGTLEVAISPDMRVYASASPYDVRVRNGLPYAVRFDRMPTVIQMELAAGAWADVNAFGNFYYLIDSSLMDVGAGEKRSAPEFRAAVGSFPDLRVVPTGRYRVAYQYARIDANGATVPSSWTVVYSNAVTVTP